MEHSRLLKYIQPATGKNNMAESVKIKFEYQTPDNVQSDVPGEQKLRENSENGNEVQNSTIRRNNSYSGQAPTIDNRKLNRRHSNISNTSAEVKIEEKKTRTKIPVSRFRQTVERVKIERRGLKEKKDQESHIPIRRSSIPKATGKTPTKPVRKTTSVAKTKDEVTKTDVTQPEIEKIEDAVAAVAKPEETETVTKTEATEVIAPEDEFDKLYEEVVHSPTPINIDVSLLNPKVDDPEKLESKFEEIIHDYDENRVQPIDVEKIKKSRIPFLKRKSQQDIDVRGDRSGKMIAARDKLRMRRSSAKSDEVIDGKANKNTNISSVKSESYAQNHVNSVKTVNTEINTVTQNDVKLKEIGSNDKIVSNNKSEGQNDVTEEEVDNVFAEIEKRKCDAQNDADYEKSVGTREAVDINIQSNGQSSLEMDIAEPDDQDNSTDNNDVSVTNVTELDDLEFSNNQEIEYVEDRLENTFDKSELNEQNMNPDIPDNVILEQTINEKVLDNLPVTEIVNNIKITTEQIKEENIYMGSIQIGIPVFNSQVQDLTEERDPEDYDKEEFSHTPHYIEAKLDEVVDKVGITETHSEGDATEVKNNTEKSIDIADTTYERENYVLRKQTEIEDKKALMKEKDGSIEDVAKLRGKVGRLISKIDTHEPVETLKIDFGNDLPKKKSVLSKIAMFERHDTEPVLKSKIPRKEAKLPKLHTANIAADKVHVHTPLIVDEMYKPFETKIVHNANVNTVETTNGDNETEIVKAEMVIIESPEIKQYVSENKVEIIPNDLIIQESKISEEVLTPVLREYEPKPEEITDENKRWLNKANEPVIVPKFMPVKEVLKRYESVNNHNHVSKKIDSIPKVKPINEIIKALKPESSPRSLDTMFAHQPRPATDILNDFKPENKNEIETLNIEVDPKLDINKKKDTTDIVIERSHKNEEKVDPKRNLNKDSKAIVFESYDKTRHGFKSYKSRDEYKTIESNDNNFKTLQYIQDYHSAKAKNEELRKAKSLAELDIGDFVKGKVNKLVDRMNSLDKIAMETKEVAIDRKELPRQRSVSEKIALFEPPRFCSNVFFERDLWQDNVCLPNQPVRKIAPMKTEPPQPAKTTPPPEELTPDLETRIAELVAARQKYGTTAVPTITLSDGTAIPVIALGTALLDPRLVFHVVCAAIDLGYRAIDTAYIYGNERAVGEAIRAKINDGTVTRGELFIMSKLWSTFHRRDLVRAACDASLEALGLDYFDLFMIHNPMSFKEGGDPIPKIATVLQYSEHDYMEAWFGMEALGARARALGLSNFNAAQVQRVLDRARVKPVVNQVECHPYLSQQRLGDFCSERNITLSCYGVLGSKGTPQEFKSGQPPVIDDPLVQVMASGLNVSPAQLLIRYQLQSGRLVVVKSSSAANLWNNLQAVNISLTNAQIDALRALNRNKRNFVFKGMGDTHKNYPFKELF